MSYDFIVYVQRERLPDPARLAEELSIVGLTTPPSIDLRGARGYVPMSDSGFEVTSSAITQEQIEDHKNALAEEGEPDDDHLAILLASDMRITFRCREPAEIATARMVAGAMAKLSNGFVCDPQLDLTVHGTYLPA
jgi:hypothetical protein